MTSSRCFTCDVPLLIVVSVIVGRVSGYSGGGNSKPQWAVTAQDSNMDIAMKTTSLVLPPHFSGSNYFSITVGGGGDAVGVNHCVPSSLSFSLILDYS